MCGFRISPQFRSVNTPVTVAESGQPLDVTSRTQLRIPDRLALERAWCYCTGNRARSQMAQGWLSHLGDRVRVWSAGTQCARESTRAIQAMAEVGIDISGHTSDHVDSYVGERFDLGVSGMRLLGRCCPSLSRAARLIHRGFEDPDRPGAGDDELMSAFRRVRDEIGEFSRSLLADEVAGPQ